MRPQPLADVSAKRADTRRGPAATRRRTRSMMDVRAMLGFTSFAPTEHPRGTRHEPGRTRPDRCWSLAGHRNIFNRCQRAARACARGRNLMVPGPDRRRRKIPSGPAITQCGSFLSDLRSPPPQSSCLVGPSAGWDSRLPLRAGRSGCCQRGEAATGGKHASARDHRALRSTVGSLADCHRCLLFMQDVGRRRTRACRRG
jgi:hypothetical protein